MHRGFFFPYSNDVLIVKKFASYCGCLSITNNLFFSFLPQIYLTDLARPGQWIFPEKLFTDQKEVKIIEDTIFSKLLDHVPYEVPYNVKIEIEYFDITDDGMQMQC